MCPCQPLDGSLPHPDFPSFSGPGFAVNLPSLNIPIPDGFPEDLLGLFNNLSMLLPSGIMKPHLSPNFSKDVLDTILSLLEKFMPFLMLYKFLLPLLNLIPCIIDILCAIPNPFKLAAAIRRLFRKCLPPFLNLFPFLALILMILSLIALIIALIEYLLAQVAKIIQAIIKNIRVFIRVTKRKDAEATLAAIRKIGLLLCFLQQLFVILGVVATIIEVIKAIASLKFKVPPCDDSGDGASIGGDPALDADGNIDDDGFPGDGNGCCTPDVCPSYIKNNTVIPSTTGTLQYFNRLAIDLNLGSVLPGLPATYQLSIDLRKESLQFYDPLLSLDKVFSNIVSPFDAPTVSFFPAGVTYDGNTDPKKVPYTVDMRVLYNPHSSFYGTSRSSDTLGQRHIRINNCIVSTSPVKYITDYQNTVISMNSGSLTLVGGKAFEDDGVTPFLLNGIQADINTFTHIDSIIGLAITPQPTDGYAFTNVEYSLKINHEILFGYNLITLGCMPDVAFDRNFINTTIAGSARFNAKQINDLVKSNDFPNTDQVKTDLLNGIAAVQGNISEASLNAFQTQVTTSLANLKNQCLTSYKVLIGIGFDKYKSKFILDKKIQFTTFPIKVSVSLNESSGKNITTSLPGTLGIDLAPRITGKTTLGVLDKFVYDGYSMFTSNLTSKDPGHGLVSIAFDNNFISVLSLPGDLTKTPSSIITQLPYQFIHVPGRPGLEDGAPRRDETDIAQDVEG